MNKMSATKNKQNQEKIKERFYSQNEENTEFTYVVQ